MDFNLENIVYTVLLKNKQARKDDFILILEVIREYCPVLLEYKLEIFFLEHKELGLPSFESITRARRKLQKLYPSLLDNETKKKREELEKEYKNYYVG